MAAEFPAFPNDSTLYRTTSAFAESDFTASGEEIQECLFDSAEVSYVNGVEIISENNVTPTILEEISTYQESNISTLYDLGESPVSPYTIKVFVSKDNSYLKEAFDKTQPLPDEVCLFLEDNSTDVFSDGTAYVKVGDHFRDDLAARREIAEAEAGNIPRFTFINDAGEQDLSINFTEEQLEQLITTGQITNATRAIMIGIFQVVNFGTLILTPVYRFLGDGIIWITGKLREHIEFQDYHWDPEAERPEDSGEFEPILCPVANELFATEVMIGEAIADTIATTLSAQLQAQKEQRMASWSAYARFPRTYPVPAAVSDFMNAAEQKILHLIEELTNGIKTMVNVFVHVGTKAVNAVNAFYCGLWNSLVEAVLGIVDMVGYLFIGLSMAGDAVNNAQTLVPQALEMLDEMVQMVMQQDFVETVTAAINAIINQLAAIDFMTLINGISVERTAYYVGGFIGFIVEMVVEALLSGGTAAVAALLTKLEKFGKIGTDVMAFVQAAIKATFRQASQLSFEYIMAIMETVLKLLRKGKDEVVKFINDLFDVIRKAAQLTDEVIAEIMQKFRITAADKQLIDELGLAFTNYADDACSMCTRTV